MCYSLLGSGHALEKLYDVPKTCIRKCIPYMLFRNKLIINNNAFSLWVVWDTHEEIYQVITVFRLVCKEPVISFLLHPFEGKIL